MENISFDLTLEQQFQMKLVEQSAGNMNREQMQELLVEISRLVMLKDNIIKGLMKECTLRL
ncbi:NblA/ycf18 family protein [Merismopedia glauca]|uniref:Photosystem I reaction center subunit XII n=1 Tax=Merismopedia glauca CCAP 1448/3 TaxID=1296344 RepID=A0A2T1C7L6_9CYAN|nr:NblA/ycf18 family protein [Merismopedia glauca]PSB04224.1 photosystem I reaction center subunit XII [Merismopedia glauca CCAP 1448/3]